MLQLPTGTAPHAGPLPAPEAALAGRNLAPPTKSCSRAVSRCCEILTKIHVQAPIVAAQLLSRGYSQ